MRRHNTNNTHDNATDGVLSMFLASLSGSTLDDIDVADRLMSEGIDPSEFEFMDDDEKCAAMRRAGIDPDDFEDEDFEDDDDEGEDDDEDDMWDDEDGDTDDFGDF